MSRPAAPGTIPETAVSDPGAIIPGRRVRAEVRTPREESSSRCTQQLAEYMPPAMPDSSGTRAWALCVEAPGGHAQAAGCAAQAPGGPAAAT